MSLQAIREMRLQRQKPGVVSVVVGQVGKRHKSDPEVVELAPGAQPRLMDWRPLVGCSVCFYQLSDDTNLMNVAFDMALAAGAKPMGYANRKAVGALCTFSNPEDERKLELLLWQGMDFLCK